MVARIFSFAFLRISRTRIPGLTSSLLITSSPAIIQSSRRRAQLLFLCSRIKVSIFHYPWQNKKANKGTSIIFLATRVQPPRDIRSNLLLRNFIFQEQYLLSVIKKTSVFFSSFLRMPYLTVGISSIQTITQAEFTIAFF